MAVIRPGNPAGRRSNVAVLRARTRAAHDRLDAAFAAGDWLRDAPGYVAYLRAVGECHHRVEAVIADRSVTVGTGFAPKRHLIDADLAVLGVDRADAADMSARGDPQPAVHRSAATGDGFVLGAIYVVEGSTLGGRRIARWVQTSTAVDVPTGFLDAYGDSIVERWRTTIAAIDAADDPVDEMVDGACWAFDVFTHRLVDGDRVA